MALALVDPTPVPEEEVTFTDFWAVYLRREAKKDAMKAWSQIPKSIWPAVINAAALWRREWSRREMNFVPLAASWLRGERWEDELPTTGYTHQSQLPTTPDKPYVRGELSTLAKELIAKQKGLR